MVEFVNVTKQYGKLFAVDKVSFKIESNSITGFLGLNGAGKSTILKMLAGIIYQTSGEVLIDSLDYVDNTLLKNQIGYVSEQPVFYNSMTVKQFLKFVASIRNIKFDSIDVAIDKCSLQSVLTKRISTLSKGYKQRLAFAQAIMHNPKILILDEPSSGLDPEQIIEMRNLIKQSSKNRITLFSTHIIQEAENLCDKIIIIKQGKILAHDTIENILLQTQSKNLEQAFLKYGENPL